MKPHILTLYNIGPFTKKTTIDFDALGSLFLICGKTGAGKSTIFDALTYALYGKLPGAKSKLDTKKIRSDFALPEEDAYVELIFSLKNKKYHLIRRPPYVFINRNGKQATKESEILLYEIKNTEEILISNKLTEANSFLQELLILTVEEFSKIVLLPQGEFAKFLKENSSERQTALAKLFPVDMYSKIITETKNRVQIYDNSLRIVQNELDKITQDFSFDTYLEDLEQLKTAISEKETYFTNLTEEIIQLATTIQLQENTCNTLLEYEEKNAEYKKILAKEQEITNSKNRLLKAQKASVLEEKIKQFKTLQQNCFETEKKAEETEKQLRETETHYKSLKSQKESIKQLQADNEKISLLIHDLTNFGNKDILLADTEKHLATIQQDKEYTEKKSQELTISLNTILEQEKELEHFDFSKDYVCLIQKAKDSLLRCEQELANAKEYDNVQEQLLSLNTEKSQIAEKIKEQEKHLQIEKELLENIVKEQKQQEEQQQAALLAETLQEGKPCPVCGATVHPQKAEKTDSLFSFEEKIQTIQETCKNYETTIASLSLQYTEREQRERIIQEQLKKLVVPETIALLQANFEKTQHEKEKLEADYEFFKNALNTKNNLQETKNELLQKKHAYQQNLSEISLEEQKLQSQTKNIHQEIQRLTNSIQDAGFSVAEKDFAHIRNRVIEHFNEKEQKITQFEQTFDTTKELFVKHQSSLEEIQKNKDQIILKMHNAEKELNENLEKHTYKNIEEVLADLLPEQTALYLQKEIDTWQEKKALLEGSLKTLEQVIAENNITSFENLQALIETNKASLQTKNTEKNQLQQALSTEKTRLHNLESNKLLFEEKMKELSQLQKEASPLKRLYNAVSGNNPKKTNFDSWILSIYLQEVTKYAARRLQKISEGRYTILLKNETGGKGYQGLDLEIFDSNTGKKRPCATLSGGETFMASISLALAISDVVQKRTGGIQLDALFIDEGFGTLDPQSQEKALSILDELSTNRRIGIISHVEELKARIPTHLQIEKNVMGSTIKLHETTGV